MEESLGAQYAIQIAVHTLRDRCKNLQYRIAVLEEENMSLRIRYNRGEDDEYSLSELDKLKEHITELMEQKEQLHNKIKMVSSENQDLWSKLGKLTTVNKNLGDQLNKISDTVNQHTATLQPHTTLIRSKTFTQNEPQTRFLQKNLEINERISLELEDVSLKLTDSFSKQKIELDKMCSEIEGMQCSNNIITENFGFYYDYELEDGLVEDIKCLLRNLNFFKEEIFLQNSIIQKTMKNINNLQEKSICKICDRKNCIGEKSTSTSDIPKSGIDKFTEVINVDCTDLNSSKEILPSEHENVCPVCSRIFQKDIDFPEFQRHVEDHFHSDIDSYELL